MASAKLVGKEKAFKDAMASIAKLEKRFAHNIEVLIVAIDHEIKSLTPVHTGQAVVNYIWSRDHPVTMVLSALGTGPTGRTNAMKLGEEPRRHENEAASEATLFSLGIAQNPFGAFYLSNNSPDIAGLEMGLLPGAPMKSRSPNGMFGITDVLFNTLVATQGILK
jgi:hypothetical protein